MIQTLLKYMPQVVTFASLAAALASLFRAYTILQQKLRERSLSKEFGSEFYTEEVIRKATQYYIKPACSSVDPGQEAELRFLLAAEEDLFSAVDKFIDQGHPRRHLLLLADSGMGKSSFALNYYLHYKRKHKKKIVLVPLGVPNPEKYIEAVPEKKRTILLLDALDEDVKAIDNHAKRLNELMQLCASFSRVIITCRTQFFPRDQEIPTKTGILEVGPRILGDPGVLEFWKLYMAPFSDRHIELYINKRFPVWQLWSKSKRKQVRRMVAQVPYLNVRPMLLSYIPELLKSEQRIVYSFQLYKILVDEWIKREGVWVEPTLLREFSERIAVDIYVKRHLRGAERIPRAELKALAQEWAINLDEWQMSGRSLLNRDALGNYKFAHRSIMEYLFAEQAMAGNALCEGITLTDQMKLFIWEMCEEQKLASGQYDFNLKAIDLRGIQPQLRENSYYINLPRGMLWEITKAKRLYDSNYNPFSPGRLHLYAEIMIEEDAFVADLASGLMWPKKSLSKQRYAGGAVGIVAQANNNLYGGFRDWRLPTLEEAMSLLTPQLNLHGLHVDDLFGSFCERILTGDAHEGIPWVVSFLHGGCLEGASPFHVVPVRSLKPSEQHEPAPEFTW